VYIRSVPKSLDRYRAKRSADRTSEPFGETSARPGLFVVQKHAARRLHWDFRLEHEGVLLSWAVPKGPSLDPADKRLAVHVEDHPADYADFEGIIPAGNYGAGAVILWDKGRYTPLEDTTEGLKKGKLLFELFGFKLRGVWTLVRTKGSHKDWLLIKKPDAFADTSGRPLRQESVHSGRSIEQLSEGRSGADDVRDQLAALSAPHNQVECAHVELMLAENVDQPFSAAGWRFEIKYDGFRLLAAREEGGPRLRYRRGNDATATFPELARAVATLPAERFVLDGELVVLDKDGRPDFQLLQKRVQLRRKIDIDRAAVDLPATLFLFDLLGFDDFDLRDLPLSARKEMLRKLLPPVGPLRYVDDLDERGEAMFEEIRKMGLEGMVAKRADSPYRPGRWPDWKKIRIDQTGDFAIVGFTEPEGSRASFGALHLAVHGPGGFVYAGRVGTGFSDRELAEIGSQLEPLRRKDAPCKGGPAGRGHVWVEPSLVCEVRYKEWTDDHLLRQPAFLRLRDDRRPEDCVRADEPARIEPDPQPAPREPHKQVPFTNLDKVFWPDQGYTKGDLLEYYRRVAPWLLAYLRDRPVVLTRFPDGITGKSFFQKDAPGFVPGWIRTERMWSAHTEREIDYFVCDDVESLLYIVNMGSIPLHVWSSRVGTLEKPDWCILDLDPKGAPLTDVVRVARTTRSLCQEIELPSFVKTSGQAGLHVMLPLGGQCTYEQSRQLGELLARVVVQKHPDIATIQRVVSAREGRVYVDYLQNGHGRTIAAPLSVRAMAGAPVSTPLRWREVTDKLNPQRFTIKTVPQRLRRAREEPLRAVMEAKPDLIRALERLAARLETVGK